MKSINLILIAIGSFMFFYLVISLIGLLWCSYIEVITEPAWFFIYAVCFGWLSIFPTAEYYEANKEYLKNILN